MWEEHVHPDTEMAAHLWLCAFAALHEDTQETETDTILLCYFRSCPGRKLPLRITVPPALTDRATRNQDGSHLVETRLSSPIESPGSTGGKPEFGKKKNNQKISLCLLPLQLRLLLGSPHVTGPSTQRINTRKTLRHLIVQEDSAWRGKGLAHSRPGAGCRVDPQANVLRPSATRNVSDGHLHKHFVNSYTFPTKGLC